VGNLCALLAAITWASALVPFKHSGDRLSPIALNLFKNVVGLACLLVTLAVMGDGLSVLRPFEPIDVIILMLSGFLGITLADTAFLQSLRLIGVGLVSIVECLYSPLVMLCSLLLLSEVLKTWDYVGAALVLSGVYISSRHAPPPGRTTRQLTAGILLGALSMVLMAFGIVIAKPVLEINNFPLIWGATLRLLMGTVALALLTLASPERRAHWAVFRPAAVWRTAIPASVLGTYLAMVFWIAGFKFTQASVAGILNQTSVVFSILLAAMFLKEPLNTRKITAVVLALAGVGLVMLE